MEKGDQRQSYSNCISRKFTLEIEKSGLGIISSSDGNIMWK